jgi:hypothetical protein
MLSNLDVETRNTTINLSLPQLELVNNNANNLTTDSIIELQKIKTQNKMLELLQHEDNRKQQIFEYQINNINLHRSARLLVVFSAFIVSIYLMLTVNDLAKILLFPIKIIGLLLDSIIVFLVDIIYCRFLNIQNTLSYSWIPFYNKYVYVENGRDIVNNFYNQHNIIEITNLLSSFTHSIDTLMCFGLFFLFTYIFSIIKNILLYESNTPL